LITSSKFQLLRNYSLKFLEEQVDNVEVLIGIHVEDSILRYSCAQDLEQNFQYLPISPDRIKTLSFLQTKAQISSQNMQDTFWVKARTS
jgi:hypothetical protein